MVTSNNEKKVKRKKLTKGLEDIFGGDLNDFIEDIEKNTPKQSQTTVKLSDVRPNPYQPRRLFDEEKLNELASSILQHGIFTPVILKKSIHGYEIVAGERRCRAAKIAKLDSIPAIIVDFSDEQMLEIALLENIQRENLNAIEEAQAYENMMKKLNLTQEQIANRLGKSRTHIANTLRLLQLPQSIQSYVLNGELTMGHVRPLITLPKEKATDLALRAIEEHLSVREIENIVRGIELSKNHPRKKIQEKDQNLVYVEDLLRKKFRTKIKVENQNIVVKYQDVDDLNRILELMGVIEESE